MKSVWIFLVSGLGMWPSLFIFTLVLFRQKIKANVKNIVISSLIMAHVTLLLQSLPLHFAIAAAQLVTYILCLYFFYRINIFYSILTSVISYMITIVEEIVFYMLLSKFHWPRFLEISQEYVILPAAVLTFLNILSSLLLYRFRLGFTFVPAKYEKDESRNKMYFTLILGIVVIAASCLTLFIWKDWILPNIIVICLLLIYSIRFLYKKELSD